MTSLECDLERAMLAESPTVALRQAVVQRLERGVERQELFQQLEALRPSADTEREDVILDVLDFIVGWCSPDMKV